jgi:hypothetical protein
MSVTTIYRMKFDAILAASKKYLIMQETMSVFPNMQSFSRLLGAAIDLHHAIDPDEEESLGARVAIGLLRLALTIIGDITIFWKMWIRG